MLKTKFFKGLLWALTLTVGALSAQTVDEATVRAKLPEFEAYVEKARKDWQVPQVAVAVVKDDKVIWWKGFGENPPDRDTLFAIGSTTKAFCAANLAQMVDDGVIAWDSRVVDQWPQFAMNDPWVTREMRVADLLAQHSGMPQQALSLLGALGYSRDDIIHTLRWVEPVSSFRSKFAYVNSLHLVAGEMIKNWAGVDSWESAVKAKLLGPLGMNRTCWTADSLDKDPNSAPGHATIKGKVQSIPAGPFPYVFGPAGGLNSSLEDMSRWVRMQLADGEFEGRRVVSAENLAVTRTPQTVINSRAFYCMGWLHHEPVKGPVIIWHNGGTPGHTTFVGLQPEEKLGIIVLSNLGGTTMPDSVSFRFFDLVHGIEGPDYSALQLAARTEPEVKPTVKISQDPAIVGAYSHPSLGLVEVLANNKLKLHKVGLVGDLRPIGSNLYALEFNSGWPNDIGWPAVGEVRFLTPGAGEPASLTLSLGDDKEGTSFTIPKAVPAGR